MEHANDLRVQRTYKLLTDALMNMLCEQSFDTITVRTLCERAMVRPATFYKHFANKEELFLSIVQHKQQQFRTGNPYRDVPGSSRNYYVSLVDQTLHFLEQNKTMVDSVIRAVPHPYSWNRFPNKSQRKSAKNSKKTKNAALACPENPKSWHSCSPAHSFNSQNGGHSTTGKPHARNSWRNAYTPSISVLKRTIDEAAGDVALFDVTIVTHIDESLQTFLHR